MHDNGDDISVGSSVTIVSQESTDLETFALENIILPRDLLGCKIKSRSTFRWTSNGLKSPLLKYSKPFAKSAILMFDMIRKYMGDKRPKKTDTINSMLVDVIDTAQPFLQDELYIQIIKQIRGNPRESSLISGWQLFTIALNYLPPSSDLQSALLDFIDKYRTYECRNQQASMYATEAHNRLLRLIHGGKRTPQKLFIHDAMAARLQIFDCTPFGLSLEEVMEYQQRFYADRQLPWPLVALAQKIFELDGRKTEGIFRIGDSPEELSRFRSRMNSWDMIASCNVNIPATILKQWLRELYYPLIPYYIYDACVQEDLTATMACEMVAKLPKLNRLTLYYLIRFLQAFSKPEVVERTKMDASNLATIFAPNCVRCPEIHPDIVIKNLRKEKIFIMYLIEGLDTDVVDDMI